MAQYVLEQYNKPSKSGDNTLFMSVLSDKTTVPTRISTDPSSGVEDGNSLTFANEALKVNAGLQAGTHYYFHGKIKKLNTVQKFNIKLYNTNASVDDPFKEQFIKNFTVSATAESNKWVDIEFIFTPLENFTHILFEMLRYTDYDVVNGQRYATIGYEELSIINNFFAEKIPNHNSSDVQVMKIGVQSRPGYLMCINGEEIRTSRTGIYEVKNGVIVIDFFSVCAAAKESTNDMIAWINTNPTSTKTNIKSATFIDKDKKREIDRFTLDYLYRIEES